MGFSAGLGFIVDTDGDGSNDGKVVTLKKGSNITMSLTGSTLTISGTGEGSSGTLSTVKLNGTQVGGADIVTLDFSSVFAVTESPDQEINIAIDDATASAKGVASFSGDNFTVSSGAVTIKDGGVILGTETTGNYVATAVAGTGIGVSGATGNVTISGTDASTSAKGIASFSADNFAVSSGVVTIKDGGVDLTAEVTGVLPIANFATKDEDTMSSNSASHVPTQQSVKAYVDSVASGLDVKDSVRVATTGNITLANQQTIDGVSVVAGNRVLVKDQSTGAENGIYLCVDGGSWTRATDMAAGSQGAGLFVFVEEGTANADNGYVCTTNDASDTVGTHSLAFAQFSGAGQITAGTNITKSGNTLNVDDAFLKNDASDTTTGTITAGGFTTAGSITLSADAHSVNDIDIDSEASDADDHIMTALAIKNRIEDYNYTTNTGDITGVTIQTDSGAGSKATDTAGSADFILEGATGVGITNSGVTITAVAVPSEIDHDALSNFVANEHIDWTGASAGTIHASNYTDTTTNTQTTYTPSVVDSSDDALIRLTAAGEGGSGTQDVKLVAGTNITLTPDATTTPHQITIAAAGGGGDAFKTIVVAGQDSVVADAAADTLTLVGGTNIAITTSAAGDSITITGSGSVAGGITVQEEGSALNTAGDTINFVGPTITASGTGTTKTVTVADFWAYDGTIATKLQPSGTLVSGITEVSYTQDEDVASSARAAADGTNASVVRKGVGARYNVTVVHGDADTGADNYTVDPNDHHILMMNNKHTDGTVNGAQIIRTVLLPAAANYIGREITVTWHGAGLSAGGIVDPVCIKPHGDDGILYMGMMWDNNQDPGNLGGLATSTGQLGMVIGPAAWTDSKFAALGIYAVGSVTMVAVDLATLNAAGTYALPTNSGAADKSLTQDTLTASGWIVTSMASISDLNQQTGYVQALLGAGVPPPTIPVGQ